MARLAALAVALGALAGAAWAMSLEEEVRTGRRVVEQLRELGLTEDPALRRMGERLKAVVERQDLPWRFWVIEDLKEYNAFAAPGGQVFITRQYFEKLSADEAAFVIGHEMAHVDLRHHARQAERRQRASLGHLLLGVLVGGRGPAWQTAADLGATAYMTRYSRALEREADFAGYRFAEEAGYDARAAVTALSKLDQGGELPVWLGSIFATHPLLSSREDRLAAMGGEEPEEVAPSGPAPEHARNLTRGLKPLEPQAPVAVRILSPEGGRWEDEWRKDFTRHLHVRLRPLGFTIAGDDIMYKPDIGDPREAARSRDARYLLLVTVHRMESEPAGEPALAGTPVRAAVEASAQMLRVEDGELLWEGRFAEEAEGVDFVPASTKMLYTDTRVGALAHQVAAEIALGCARAAGAEPAQAE